ncbi:putative tetratricopeptide TPR2 protein [Reticulomyxa filosa]|uniref:Putative tetratricopeptide TPR2 protein n=1 Tax=Reticulomyxa filosa TaxID=46433 RepID=X6PE33_RETFI|nr:putative tetratricopeptide TPR2 protein [Reticulomyxa filosa]|eukprot:ETO36770.1 putative tetratricopeptide TPR2 protein [Reticulomyxa filosa]
MSSIETFVTIGSNKYTLHLTNLSFEGLKEQIVEVNKNNEQRNVLTKITDCDGHEIETDEQLQNIFDDFHSLHLYAYFQPTSTEKNAEKKQTMPFHQVKNPLVLLAGAMKYESQQSHLEGVKQDLDLFESLFQSKLGYQTFNTYNSQNTNTESLTLSDLNSFILRHRLDFINDNKFYDSLIFVWCGYTNFENTLLVTSDCQTKSWSDIQNELVINSEAKPKIFIVISYKQEIDNNAENVLCKQSGDVFTIIVNTKHLFDNSRNERKESHFTEMFCQIVQNNVNQSLQFVINQIMQRKITLHSLNFDTDIYLIPRLHNNDNKKDKISLMTVETLDLKKHWNKNWRKANAEAAKIVMKMLTANEQGLIIVASNTKLWQMAIRKCSITMEDTLFSLRVLINNEKTEKQQFEEYYLYVIKSKLVVLSEINIDGNAYAVNSEIQCKGKNVKITTQLFVTNNTTIDKQLLKFISPIQWNAKIHHDILVYIQDLEDRAHNHLAETSFNDAINCLQQALEFSIDNFGINHPYIGITYCLIGISYRSDSKYDEAIEYYEKALNTFLSIFGNEHIHIGNTYFHLGQGHFYKQDYDKTIEYYEHSLKIRKGKLEIKDRYSGDSYWNLGLTFEKKGEKNNACQYYEKAWKEYSMIFGEWNEETLQAKEEVNALQ